MGFRDFCLLALICFIWGLNIVVTRWVVFDMAVPPIFFAAVRFLGIAIVLAWFLRPIPKQFGMLFLICMCIGAGHFTLLFVGLADAEASAASITGQLAVPFSTLMSMAFLGETVGWRRGLGIMLAFAGVTLIAVDPESFTVSNGLLLIVGSSLVGATGAILMKRIAPMSPMQLQAWVGLLSFLPLFALSGLFETQQWGSYTSGGAWVWAATAYAIFAVSIIGHGGFYFLIKHYDISLLSPLTLMTPVWGVVLSIVMLNEPITAQLVLGSVISLGGVFVIAVRQNKALPEAALGKKIGGAPS